MSFVAKKLRNKHKTDSKSLQPPFSLFLVLLSPSHCSSLQHPENGRQKARGEITPPHCSEMRFPNFHFD